MSDTDKLVADFIAKRGVTKLKPAEKHAISNKKWEGITQSPGKTRVSGDTVRAAPHNVTGGTNTLAGHDEPATSPYKFKHPENALRVRDTKTGPKGGGKVHTSIGNGRFTRAAMNTGKTHADSVGKERELHVQGDYTRRPPAPKPEDPIMPGKRVSRSHMITHALNPGAIKREETMSDELVEKYVGFKKLAAKVGAGAAAAIGRKKYGKEKFQKAAAEGKKMKGMHKEEELLSAAELSKLQELDAAFEIDEAKRGKRVPSANIPNSTGGKNSDQSGVNDRQDVASVGRGGATISDEFIPEEPKVVITADQPVKHAGQLPGS